MQVKLLNNSTLFTIESMVLPIFLTVLGVVLGVVIGVWADRKKLNYQTKSDAKANLLSGIYRAIGSYYELEEALKTNSLNENQWNQLIHYAALINEKNSFVKALGLEVKNLSAEVQMLITTMYILGNKILNCKGTSNKKRLTLLANEGHRMMLDAESLADKIRKNFQKKKYIIF